MGKELTQKDLIIKYIKDFGSISSWEAYQELGITQLGARIFELKRRGYIFQKDKIKKLNRYGKEISFDKYKIVFEGKTEVDYGEEHLQDKTGTVERESY